MKCTKCNKEFAKRYKDRHNQCQECITTRLNASGHKRYLSRKIKLLKIHGGQCKICTYNKNIASLVFHHKIPKKKLFEVNGWAFRNKSWEVLLMEARKCMLLCHNCHYELHHPDKNYLL